MKKEDALRIIVSCSEMYHLNLEDKNYLFVYRQAVGPYLYLEASFFSRNFFHLTGIELNNRRFSSADDFLSACLNHQIDPDYFALKTDGTTDQKLKVLPALMQIQTCANMLGDYDGTRIKLQTDKIVGNVQGCMGFVLQNNIYVPNTVLCKDTRDSVYSPCGKIDAIYSKPISSDKYQHIRYLSKRLNNNQPKLPKCIEDMIDTDNLCSCFGTIKPWDNIYG